jgi:hypothetical protein
MAIRILKQASLCVCAGLVVVCTAGCPFSLPDILAGWGESMLEPELIGTWKLVEMTNSGVTVTCPGENADLGFSCTDNETLTLQSDGNYEETISSTVDDEGLWFAVDGIMMLDDELTPDNSGAFTYEIDGNTMTARTLSGGLEVVYERQGAASTLTQADIVRADSSLRFANLMDANLVGTWEYISIDFNGVLVECPGDSGIPGISCGENELMIFKADNTFDETVSNTDHSTGRWYATHDILLFDDPTFEDHDPTSWTYTIHDDILTMRTFSGALISTLRRVP